MNNREKLEKLNEIYNDINYDINTVWDDTYEDDYDRIATIKSVLSFFQNNNEVKDELIDIIKYYVFRFYEETRGDE